MVFRGRISIRGKGRGSRKRGRGLIIGEPREIFKPGNAPKSEPVFRMANTSANVDEALSRQPWPPNSSNYKDDRDVNNSSNYGKSFSPPRIHTNDRRSPERLSERSSRGSHSSSLSKSNYDSYKGGRSRDKSRSPERRRHRSRSHSRSRTRHRSRSRHRSPSTHRSRSRNRSRSRSRRSRSTDRKRSTSRNRDHTRLQAISRSRSPSIISSNSDGDSRKIPVASDPALLKEENRRGLFPLPTESLRITVGNERFTERGEFPTVSEDILQDAIEIVKDYQSSVKDFGRRQETSDSHLDSLGKEIPLDTFRSHSLEKKFSPSYSSLYSSRDHIDSNKSHHFDRKSPSPVRKRELHKRDDAYQHHSQHHKPSSSSTSRQSSSSLKSILKQKEESFFSKSGAVMIPGLDAVHDIDDEEAFLYGEESRSHKTKEKKIDKNDSVKKISNLTDIRSTNSQSKNSHSVHNPSLDIIQSKSEAAKKELANILQVIGFGVPQDAIERIKLKAESMDETMRLQEARMQELKNKDYKTKDSKELLFEQNSSFPEGNLNMSPLNQRVSGVETNWNQIPVNPIQSRQDPLYPEYPSVPMQHSEYPKVQSHHSDFPQVKSDHSDFSQIPNQHPYYWPPSSLPPPNFPYPPPQPPYGPPSLHHMPGPLPPHYGYDTPLNEEMQPSRSNLRVIPIQKSSESMQELPAKSNFKNLVKENKISRDSPPIKKAVEPVKELKPILKKSNIDEVKKEIKSELPKENAQKFASREEYLSMLVNKQTDYTFLISNLNKEIDYLRKQQGELMRKYRKQKDGHKDPLLLENTLLQDEVSRKVKDITQHLDDVKAAIKDINTNQSNFRSALTIRRILSEVALKKDKDKQEKTDETLYEYFDSGNHWCRYCNEKAASMFEMLDHIQSQQHKQNLDPFLRPWRKEAAKTNTISSRPKSNVFVAPIKGFEFLIPAASFYCQLCHEFSGDSNSAFDHLKTPEHHKKYLKYTEENQFYERRLNLEKAVGLILRKEKLKRRNEDAIELERKAKEQKKYENEKEIDKLLAYKISQSESSDGSPNYKKPDANNSETKKFETKISEPKSPETKQTEIENEAEMDDSFGFGKFSWKKDNPSANDVSVLETEGTDAKSLKSKIAIKLTGKTVIPSTAATPWQPVMKRLLVNKPVLIKKGPMFPLRKTKVERQDKPVPLDVFINLKIGTGQTAKVDSPQSLISQEDISAAFSGKEVDTDIDVTIPQDVTPDQAVDSTTTEKLNIKSNSVKEPNSGDQQKASGEPNISEAQTTKQIAPISAEKVTAETAGLIALNVSSNDSFVFKVPNQPDINYRSKVVKETKPVPTSIQTSLSNKGNIKEPLLSSSQNSLSIQNISPQKILKNTEMQNKEYISDQSTKNESLPIVTISDMSSTLQPNESSILSSNVSAEEIIFGPHLPENINEKEIEKFNTEKLSVESKQVLVTAGNEQNEDINMIEMPTSTTEILVAPHTVLKDENQMCAPSGSLEQTKNIETLKFEPKPEKIEDNESSNILSMNISKDTILQTEENKQVQENASNFTSVDKTVNIDFQSDKQSVQENSMSEIVSSCLEMMTNQTDIEVKNLEESVLKTSSNDVLKYEKSDGKTSEVISVNIPNENVEMIESTKQKKEISFTNLVTPQLEKMDILIEANQGVNSCQLKIDTSTDNPSSNEMIIDSTETISVLQETSKEFGVLIETNAALTEEKQTDCLSIQSGASNLENKLKDYVSPISIIAVEKVTPINEDMENILPPGENISPIIVNDLICKPTINISDKETYISTVLIDDGDKNKLEKISHSDIQKDQIVKNIFEKEKIKPSINLEVIDETKVQIIQNIEPSVSGLEPSQTLNTVYKEMIESETKEATSSKVITKRKSSSKHNLIDVSESIFKPVIHKKKGISEEKHIGLKEVRIVIERCDEQSNPINKISKVTTADKFVKNDGGKKMKMDENFGKNKRKTLARDEKPEDKNENKHHKKKKGKYINEVKDSYLGEEIKNESKAEVIIDVENEKSDVQKMDCETSNFPVGQEDRNIIENKINEKTGNNYVDKKNNSEVSESKTFEPEKEMIESELEENMDHKTSEIQVENKISKTIENKEMINISPEVNETKIEVENEKLKGEMVIKEFVGKSDAETTEIRDINKLENWVEIKISDAKNEYNALALEGKHEDKAESEQARKESEINCEIIEIQSELEQVNKVENKINKKSANKVEVSNAKTVEHESKLKIENLQNQYNDKKIENDYENRIENETNKSEIEYGNKKNSKLIVPKTIEGKHENELNERKSEHEYERKIDYADNKIEIENISEIIDRNDMRMEQSGAKIIENEKSNAYDEKMDFEISEIPIKDEYANKVETKRIEIKVDSGYKLDENDSEIKKVEENQIEKETSLGINKLPYEISDNKNDGEKETNILKDESDSEKKNVHYEITIKEAETKKGEVEIDFCYKDKNDFEIGSKAKDVEENKEMGQSILTKVDKYEDKIENKVRDDEKLEGIENETSLPQSNVSPLENPLDKGSTLDPVVDSCNEKKQIPDKKATEIEMNFENIVKETTETDKAKDISIKSQIEIVQTCEQKINKDNSQSNGMMIKIENQESVNINVMVPEQISTIEATSLLECPNRMAEIDNNTSCTDIKTEDGTVNEFELHSNFSEISEETEKKFIDKYEDKKIESKVRDGEIIKGIENEISLPQSNVNPLENPLDKGSTLEPIMERCNEKQQIPDKKTTEIEMNFENVDKRTTETDKAKDISIKPSLIEVVQTCEQKLNKDNGESCGIRTKIGNQESVNIKVMVPEQMSNIEVTSLLKCPIKMAEIDNNTSNNTSCTDIKNEAGTVNNVEPHFDFSEISEETKKESISAIPSGSSEDQMESNSDVQMFSVLGVLTKMCEETASNPSRLESTSFTAESDKTSSTYSLVDSTKHSNINSSSNQTSDLLAPITICQFKGTDESEVNASMNEASSECQHLPDDKFKDIEEKK